MTFLSKLQLQITSKSADLITLSIQNYYDSKLKTKLRIYYYAGPGSIHGFIISDQWTMILKAYHNFQLGLEHKKSNVEHVFILQSWVKQQITSDMGFIWI